MLLPGGDRLLDDDGAGAGGGVPAGQVLFGGNAWRDWPTVLKAVFELADLPCTIVGGSRRNLEKHLVAMKRPWPTNLVQIDFVPPDEFIAAIRAARVVVVPLTAESPDGGHTTVALAQRVGVPVVCTAGAVLADYCQAERTALVVEPEKPEELCCAIRRVWDDRALRERLASAARAAELERDRRFRSDLQAAIDRAAAALRTD